MCRAFYTWAVGQNRFMLVRSHMAALQQSKLWHTVKVPAKLECILEKEKIPAWHCCCCLVYKGLHTVVPFNWGVAVFDVCDATFQALALDGPGSIGYPTNQGAFSQMMNCVLCVLCYRASAYAGTAR